MSTENTTANRGYQLPFADNELAVDVLRLISAFSAIDVDIANMLVSIGQRALVGHTHVIADTTGLQAALDSKQDESERGNANGYASLGSDGKVPAAQLPTTLFGSLNYQGDWNANTNTPTIPAAALGNKGWYYMVSVAGASSVGGITDWKVGDWAVSDGTKWVKIDNTDAVASVAGLVGAISAASLKTALAIAIADVSGLQTALDAKAAMAVANTFTAQQQFRVNSVGAINSYAGSAGGLMAVANTSPSVGPALIEFHRPGTFASLFGVDTDNKLKWGGWSLGANAYEILHQGNYATYAVRLSADSLLSGAGITAVAPNDGTKAAGANYQPTPAGGNLRSVTFNGALTVTAPAAGNSYTMLIEVINGATAGALTYSGFHVVDGDPYVTTNGAVFWFQIVVVNGVKSLTIKQVFP